MSAHRAMKMKSMDGDRARSVSPIARASVTHTVKSWPHLFEATLSGHKKHDMRRVADRDYRVNDILRMREYDPDTMAYTGRELNAKITYITSTEMPCALSGDGLSDGYCILSIELQRR